MTDRALIRRCLEIAANGEGLVAPNPMVGCVIVQGGNIIGEGFHGKYGGPHAEVNAVNAVREKKRLPAATLYVNLEPCCIHGNTPPCTDLILKIGIRRVVVGCRDPNPKVNGKGIAQLKRAGCMVKEGILEEECRRMNRRFYTFHKEKRPYVILKWAQTPEGYIAPPVHKAGHPFRITGEEAQMLVHKWRSEEQAILVGTNTALMDNPGLNVRHWHGSDPICIVPDRSLRLPAGLRIFRSDRHTLVFTEKNKKSHHHTEYVRMDFSGDPLSKMLEILHRRKILSLLVEGGKQLLDAFLLTGCWDEARVFTGSRSLYNGLSAPQLKGELIEQIAVGYDIVRIYYPAIHPPAP